jgi:hypothetical protein
MLFRRDASAIIAISQPSHAWLSGQLARCWGNAGFRAPEPYEDVCLGAEQHDIAWLEWERHPTLNPATGLPHEFREIGIDTRIALWSRGIDLAFAFGHYPALLVSLHAHTIHSNFATPSAGSASGPISEDRRKMLTFLDTQHALREGILASLAAQARYRDFVGPEICERNRNLIYAVDRLSLEICWGVRDEATIPNVSLDGHTKIDLHLRPRAGKTDDLILDPWPFSAVECKVLCEGHRLETHFRDEATMREALADPHGCVMIEAKLRPH